MMSCVDFGRVRLEWMGLSDYGRGFVLHGAILPVISWETRWTKRIGQRKSQTCICWMSRLPTLYNRPAEAARSRKNCAGCRLQNPARMCRQCISKEHEGCEISGGRPPRGFQSHYEQRGRHVGRLLRTDFVDALICSNCSISSLPASTGHTIRTALRLQPH